MLTSFLPLLLAAQVASMAADAVPVNPSPSAGTASPAAARPPRNETERLRAEVERLQAELQRQSLIADNARQQADQVKQEMGLKDELLLLGRQRNAELFASATEILERYRKKDFGAVLKSSEPFVQASRVKLENLVQDYEDKLRAARVTEATLPPSVEARMKQDLGGASAESAARPAPEPQN